MTEKLFLEQLETINGAIRFVCHSGGLRDQDAEDFKSIVHLKLIENDYAILGKHDPRSSFRGYIAVVVHRLLLDYRNSQWGKFHASAEAKRLGEPAITIEAMLHRDGRTIDEVLPALIRRWPELTRERVEQVEAALPMRTRRPRAVEIDLAADTVGADEVTVEDAAFEADRQELANRIAAIMRETTKELDERDRLIFRLHFDGGMSVADISRLLRVEQKPLYRRLKRAVAKTRARLERAGISAEEANEVLSARGVDLDFGFSGGSTDPRPSSDQEET